MEEDVLFIDRADAGRRLAALLGKYRDTDAVVLALPRGGVVVGKEIARELHCPLDISISRKIGHPYNPEYAIGAISESGYIVGNRSELESIDQAWLHREIEHQKQEIERRREVYTKGRTPVSIGGKTAIIVDDGIATGSTMMAAIHEIKAKKPSRIVVAVPVSPKDTAESIGKQVDEFVSVSVPDIFLGAIGAYYANFEQVSDEEVIELLEESAQGGQ